MDAILEVIKEAPSLLQTIANSNVAGMLTVVGLIFVTTACVASYQYMSAEPQAVGSGRKVIVIILLIAGCFFSTVGPIIALWNAIKPTPSACLTPIIDKNTSIDNLSDNKRASYLARFIFYNDKQKELKIDRLTHLGRPAHRYTFVSDYADVQGLNVAEAAKRNGLEINDGDHVSVVVFPLKGSRIIYPASARGLLQVISKIESEGSPGEKFGVLSRLGNNEMSEQLSSHDIESYKWQSYNQNYRSYCIVAQEFRCSLRRTGKTYGASSLIGDITADWHPLGYSKKYPPQIDPCSPSGEDQCSFTGPEFPREKISNRFGARSFLTDNSELSDLTGRMIFDYDHPGNQKLPILAE